MLAWLHCTACVCRPTLPSALQVDGESHVVHVEEEAAGTRLAVGPATCLLAKEADPSRLMASSPGEEDWWSGAHCTGSMH